MQHPELSKETAASAIVKWNLDMLFDPLPFSGTALWLLGNSSPPGVTCKRDMFLFLNGFENLIRRVRILCYASRVA